MAKRCKLVYYPAARAGESYTVREGTCVIGSYAFSGSALQTINLPGSVWSLESYAFAGCDGLTELPELTADLLTVLPEGAFLACHGLTEITLPENIRRIGDRAFASCLNLTRVATTDAITGIGNNAFPASVMLMGAAGSYTEQYAKENNLLFWDPDTQVLPESVALPTETISMIRGDTVRLEAQLMPENAATVPYRWSSTNPAVATVDETGLVRALSGGETTIVLDCGNGLTAECKVQVNTGIPVDQIVLDAESITLPETQTYALLATLLPRNATETQLNWISENEDVCTVDESGLVTALGFGETDIIVTAPSGQQAICHVTVNKRVQHLALTMPEEPVYVGDHVSFTVLIEPEDAFDNTLIWTVQPADAAKVEEDGTITFLKPGYIQITATAADLMRVAASMEVECRSLQVWQLPAFLTEIEEKAFYGNPMHMIIVPEGVQFIGAYAFAECPDLYKVILPASVGFIDPTAFEGTAVTLVCHEDSYAWQWADENQVPCRPVP